MTVSSRNYQLFNPLPMALAHYEHECTATLTRLGYSSSSIAPSTPADEKDASRLARAGSHLQAVLSARRQHRDCIVLWPTFGWVEPLLWAGSKGTVRVVVHDPIAIRHQYGHGPVLRRVGKLALDRSRLELVCHTDEAATAAKASLGLPRLPSVMLHPIADHRPQVTRGYREGVVLVAGEFKPTRDVQLLERLGPKLRDAGLLPTIRGRGWPTIPGWDVVSEFVTEEQFEAALQEADALLVPYTRYWQSGVAIRALELSVPTVGLRTSFLELLLGDDYPALVPPPGTADEWFDTITRTASSPPDMEQRRVAYQRIADETWRATLG
jgi:hypothetical protein